MRLCLQEAHEMQSACALHFVFSNTVGRRRLRMGLVSTVILEAASLFHALPALARPLCHSLPLRPA